MQRNAKAYKTAEEYFNRDFKQSKISNPVKENFAILPQLIDTQSDISQNVPYSGYQANNSGDKQGATLKWETLHYSSVSDPKVFGPAYWFTYHTAAANYPVEPSAIYREKMKGYILGIPYTLPCEACADHATSYIESIKHNLDNIISSRDKLFNFFVDFHNYVNARYGKPIMSYQDARKIYTSGVNITKLSY